MQLRPCIRSLFPDDIAGSELVDLAQASNLYEEEKALVTNAVPKRVVEFRAGRHCAREALSMLGRRPVPILAKNRAPIWPEGVVGAITHCDGFCGAVLAAQPLAKGIGFDALPANAVSAQAWTEIASSYEQRSTPTPVWRTIAFCAKEAIYKAQYALTHSWLGFQDVSIESFGPGMFRARLHRDVSHFGRGGDLIVGHYVEDQHVIFAGVYLAADSSRYY